jgi:hypothetical protein
VKQRRPSSSKSKVNEPSPLKPYAIRTDQIVRPAVPSQLENFRSLSKSLQDNPRSVPPLEQAAFRDLILGMYPGAGEPWEYDTIEHLFPEEWRRYCEWQWGTPEEQHGTTH